MKVSRKVWAGVAILAGLIVIGLGGWIAVGLVSIAGVATPKYEVLSSHDGYEKREYAPQIAAEVTVGGTYREAMNSGFRKLADYIFGNNTSQTAGGAVSEEIAMTAPVLAQASPSEAIAMTAPVIARDTPDGTYVVSFVMPAQYTMATLPRPNNAEIRLVEVPKKKYAVLEFSGRVTHEDAEAKKAALAALLARDGISTSAEPQLAQYNPPWTPPFMRHNEILVEIP